MILNRDRSQPGTPHDSPTGKTPANWLRKSLPGEFLLLAMMLHAAIGALAWSIASVRAPQNLLMVVAGVWIMLRAAGVFAQRSFALVAGLILLVGLFAVPCRDTSLEDATGGVFSATAFAVLLGVLLLVDAGEFFFSTAGVKWRQRMRSWNWHRIALGVAAAAFVIYMILLPTAYWVAEMINPPKGGQVLEEMSLSETIQLRAMTVVTAAVFGALGATIGSFLNVVAYRLPRGESLVLQRSRCPQCGVQIEGRDNLPILGWMLLGGRCRACQTRISFRYPAVEAVAAGMFLLLYFVELISGGANLPVRSPNTYTGVVWIIFYTKWDLIGIYFFHCFTLCVLLTWGLIDFDRQRIDNEKQTGGYSHPHRVPWWMSGTVAAILLLLPLLMPMLLPAPWLNKTNDPTEGGAWFATGVMGGIIGAMLGWLVSLVVKRYVRLKEEGAETGGAKYWLPGGHLVSAGLIAGLTVGWQAILGVWLLTLAMTPFVAGLFKWFKLREPPITAILLAAFLLHLALWRWLAVWWWPSHVTTPVAWLGIAAALLLLMGVNFAMPKRSA